jgi:para-aminobenzoate synthetase component 1
MAAYHPPFYHELPYLSDSSVYFELIRNLAWPIFLDSNYQENNQQGRYDILTAQPIVKITTAENKTRVSKLSVPDEEFDTDPFNVLQQQLASFPKQVKVDLPFIGGALGYFGYDLGRYIESVPNIAEDHEHIPDMAVGIYDWSIIIDHETKSACLASFLVHPDTHDFCQSLLAKLKQNESTSSPSCEPFKVTGELRENLPQDDYQAAFESIKHYILEGDCYQVNLAKRFEITASGDTWSAYKKLRALNAAPFSAYLDFDDVALLSSSPERLLQVKNNQVETKPIKGTRRRILTDPEQDQALAEELLNSVKDRAENLMIVDLLRNDLGKVCIPGSIKVPKPFALESFTNVHHLVSTVTGTLQSEQNPVSLLKACFPGGSITGAPKLRAMEIIEELEPHRRGAYCGSIAYIGFDGEMDSNILIRTLVYSHDSLRFWAGGGIVHDSTAVAEYQEVHDKAASMLKLIDQLR